MLLIKVEMFEMRRKMSTRIKIQIGGSPEDQLTGELQSYDKVPLTMFYKKHTLLHQTSGIWREKILFYHQCVNNFFTLLNNYRLKTLSCPKNYLEPLIFYYWFQLCTIY